MLIGLRVQSFGLQAAGLGTSGLSGYFRFEFSSFCSGITAVRFRAADNTCFGVGVFGVVGGFRLLGAGLGFWVSEYRTGVWKLG